MNAIPQAPAGTTIVTHRTIAASVGHVWNSLRFYEELDGQPPLLLQLVLPRAERTTPKRPAVGDETTLQYKGGHYARRVMTLNAPHLYEFEVFAQQFAADRGIRFHGGAFSLRELAPGQTDLAVTTRYTSGRQTSGLGQSLEAYVCRQLQGHLLDGIEAVAAGG